MAIRPHNGVLTMETMLFADEVVPPDSLEDLGTDTKKTTKRELDMARQLIDSLSGDFDPDKYRDEYRDRVLDLIERKAQGEEIVVEAAPEQPKEVPDLMAALEASIAAAKSPGGRKTSEKSSDGAKPKKPRQPLQGIGRRQVVERRQEVQRLRLAPQDGQEVARPVPARRVRGAGGGPHALPLEPRQGHVPRGGLHQGAGDRLLHARGAGAAAAPARPSAHAEALSQRRGGPVLLREAVPVAPARLGEHRRRSPPGARRSTSASARTSPRSCGWRTWPTSSCTRRCRWPPRSSARP